MKSVSSIIEFTVCNNCQRTVQTIYITEGGCIWCDAEYWYKRKELKDVEVDSSGSA